MTKEKQTQLEFPCQFVFKAVGLTHPKLSQIVFDIVKKYSPEIKQSQLHSNKSSAEKYTSVTISIKATSKNQIDDIYSNLNASEFIKMVL